MIRDRIYGSTSGITQIKVLLYFVFFCGTTAQQHNSGLGRLTVEVFDHTQLYICSQQKSSDEWSARRRGRYLNNTQHTQETNIHALRVIRTRDPSNQAAADLRLRSRGHRHRQKDSHSQTWRVLVSLTQNGASRNCVASFYLFVYIWEIYISRCCDHWGLLLLTCQYIHKH